MMMNFNTAYFVNDMLDLSKILPKNGDIAYCNHKFYMFDNLYWIELTRDKILPISQFKVNYIKPFSKTNYM